MIFLGWNAISVSWWGLSPTHQSHSINCFRRIKSNNFYIAYHLQRSSLNRHQKGLVHFVQMGLFHQFAEDFLGYLFLFFRPVPCFLKKRKLLKFYAVIPWMNVNLRQIDITDHHSFWRSTSEWSHCLSCKNFSDHLALCRNISGKNLIDKHVYTILSTKSILLCPSRKDFYLFPVLNIMLFRRRFSVHFYVHNSLTFFCDKWN